MYSNRSAGTPARVALVKLLLFSLARLPILHASPILSSVLEKYDEQPPKSPEDPSLWIYLTVAAALVITGGAFAGLTIALMGQDEIYLQVIRTSGEGAEKRNADKVLKLLNKGKHWVLVTLLLSNVITNETLPIVLDRSLGGGWPAVLGSTVLIVIFGEVVPQSICVRYGLPIGAWMAPCVLTLMYIMSPVAWPIAKLLDRLLGEDHGTIYKKAGLKTLVTLHKNLGAAGEQLNSDEVTIISAVLDLKEKSVGSIMVPMQDVFTMSADTILDEPTMDMVLSQGYSRIPIHSPENPKNFVGMLLVKMLITYDPEDCKQVRDFALATLPETRPETSCLDIVNFFQEGKSHMVLVSEYPGEDHGACGVVTLEDVIEELIGEEIIDESDVFIDVHKAIRRMAPAPQSRVPKNRVVEIPPIAHDLLGGIEPSTSPKSTHEGDLDHPGRKSLSGLGSPPQPTFYLRKSRTYDSSDGLGELVIKRGATPEIRQQLKHLGPSNLASRPRQTRYNAVKIKPGNSSPTKLSLENEPPRRRASESASLHMLDDGEQQRSKPPYPGVGDRSTNSTPTARPTIEKVNKATSAQNDLLQFDLSHQRHTMSDDAYEHQAQSSRGRETSPNTIHSITPPLIPRGPTRTGSITEQIVDSHGVRKIILQTNSPSQSDEENSSNSAKGKYRASPPNSINTYERTQHPRSHGLTNGHETTIEPSTSAHAGKKKRRRKRKGGASKDATHEGETQPLLSPR